MNSMTNLTKPQEAPFRVDVVSDARCHERVFAAAAVPIVTVHKLTLTHLLP